MLTHQNKTYLTIEELSQYLPEKPSKSSIYQWTHNSRIPYKKIGRRLYFDQAMIDRWEAQGRPFSFQIEQ